MCPGLAPPCRRSRDDVTDLELRRSPPRVPVLAADRSSRSEHAGFLSRSRRNRRRDALDSGDVAAVTASIGCGPHRTHKVVPSVGRSQHDVRSRAARSSEAVVLPCATLSRAPPQRACPRGPRGSGDWRCRLPTYVPGDPSPSQPNAFQTFPPSVELNCRMHWARVTPFERRPRPCLWAGSTAAAPIRPCTASACARPCAPVQSPSFRCGHSFPGSRYSCDCSELRCAVGPKAGCWGCLSAGGPVLVINARRWRLDRRTRADSRSTVVGGPAHQRRTLPPNGVSPSRMSQCDSEVEGDPTRHSRRRTGRRVRGDRRRGQESLVFHEIPAVPSGSPPSRCRLSPPFVYAADLETPIQLCSPTRNVSVRPRWLCCSRRRGA